MSDLFIVTSIHAGTRLEFHGAIPRGMRLDDGATFAVAIVGKPLSATVEVYDDRPSHWSAFFRDLAANWRGWSGEKSRESLEGHLRMACTVDRTGHVRLRVCLRGDMHGSDWRAEDSIHLDAGQLEAIARDATEYFGS